MKKRSVSLVVLMGMLFLSASATFLIPSVNQIDNPIEGLRTSAGEITIVTPENKTYTEPDRGYYPATFGFENELTGTTSTDIKFVDYDQGESNTKAEVIDEYQGHKKILNCSVDSGVSYLQVYNNFTSPQTSGSIEFWWLISDASKAGAIYFEEAWEDANIHFYIDNGNFVWYDESAHILASANSNQWYRNIIIFNCTSDKFTWEIYYSNGTLHASVLNSNFRNAASTINEFRISTWEATTWFMCFDAICYSWDTNYNIGDNLNEGLLLSYDNTTTLDWQGYSLNGQANRTILGNTTIPMPADGLHSIQVFGNDSVGTMYESDVRYFTTNALGPDITIIGPISNQLYGTTPPDFSLSIPDTDLDARWYSFDGGVTTIPFTGLSGTIDQTEWDKIGNGTATLTFYANDTTGNINQAEVTVRKDVIAPLITINDPSSTEEFEFTPIYDIDVDDPIFDEVWYTIDNGVNNFTITEFLGTIDSAAWAITPSGPVTIRFYARDLAGNIGTSFVIVVKTSAQEPPPPGIPGYDLYLLIGTLSAITVLLIRKRLKS